MVGCVIVKAGKVIAEGYHHRAGQAHAERLALKNAGSKARGAAQLTYRGQHEVSNF